MFSLCIIYNWNGLSTLRVCKTQLMSNKNQISFMHYEEANKLMFLLTKFSLFVSVWNEYEIAMIFLLCKVNILGFMWFYFTYNFLHYYF